MCMGLCVQRNKRIGNSLQSHEKNVMSVTQTSGTLLVRPASKIHEVWPLHDKVVCTRQRNVALQPTEVGSSARWLTHSSLRSDVGFALQTV